MWIPFKSLHYGYVWEDIKHNYLSSCLLYMNTITCSQVLCCHNEWHKHVSHLNLPPFLLKNIDIGFMSFMIAKFKYQCVLSSKRLISLDKMQPECRFYCIIWCIMCYIWKNTPLLMNCTYYCHRICIGFRVYCWVLVDCLKTRNDFSYFMK
jgi:hypothetical protein